MAEPGHGPAICYLTILVGLRPVPALAEDQKVDQVVSRKGVLVGEDVAGTAEVKSYPCR